MVTVTRMSSIWFLAVPSWAYAAHGGVGVAEATTASGSFLG
jgi:hypothetical protein